MDLKFLQAVREYELKQVLSLIPAQSKVLEIGAGAGWQARYLADNGLSVEAIDIPGSMYEQGRVFPVAEYDGVCIPFPDQYFDVVFSSNVLEHVRHVEDFQAEIQRVLKREGLAIHILPTGTWRFWTNFTYYIHFLKLFAASMFQGSSSHETTSSPANRAMLNTRRTSLFAKVRNNIVPQRHGEVGNCLTEIYWFSRSRWLKLFRRTGWAVEICRPNRLFYTGAALVSSKLSVKTRRVASYIVGSSCLIYVLRKAGSSHSR